MKWMVCGAFLGMASFSQISAQTPLDVKTGEWETTTTSQGMGGAMPALPPGMLDKLPPEQRAKMEERMKAMSGPSTRTSKSCVTKENLANAFQSKDVPASCKYSFTTSTRSKQEGTVSCETERAKSNGTFSFEAIDSGHAKGQIKTTTTMAGREGQGMNLALTFDSKWVGPVCAEEKGKGK